MIYFEILHKYDQWIFLIFPKFEADVLNFYPNLRLGMFLKCSKIFEKSQPDVLINSVLIKKQGPAGQRCVHEAHQAHEAHEAHKAHIAHLAHPVHQAHSAMLMLDCPNDFHISTLLHHKFTTCEQIQVRFWIFYKTWPSGTFLLKVIHWTSFFLPYIFCCLETAFSRAAVLLWMNAYIQIIFQYMIVHSMPHACFFSFNFSF